MQVFGPWLPVLFGFGAILLIVGLVAAQYAEITGSRSIRALGRGASNVGWRLMLLAVFVYVMARVLEAIFDNMLSNPP